MKLLAVETDGSAVVLDIVSAEAVGEAFEMAVGGYFEHVRVRVGEQNFSMWVNENGIAEGLPPNDFVSCILYPGVIRGCVVLSGPPTHDGETTGLSDDDVRLLAETLAVELEP